MTQEHPITPSPELVREWTRYRGFETPEVLWHTIATHAARWGADQELEACIDYFLEYDSSWGENSELLTGLRAARRPRPPSLKEQAIEILDDIDTQLDAVHYNILRRALETLPD